MGYPIPVKAFFMWPRFSIWVAPGLSKASAVTSKNFPFATTPAVPESVKKQRMIEAPLEFILTITSYYPAERGKWVIVFVKIALLSWPGVIVMVFSVFVFPGLTTSGSICSSV